MNEDIAKIVIFEDEKEHQRKFQLTFEAIGCTPLFFDNPRPSRDNTIYERIATFSPQLAIVDSWFGDSRNAGFFIVSYLQEKFSDLPIIICSQLFFREDKNGTKARYNELYFQYKGLPGVHAVIGKNPFPAGEDILNAVA